jgi:hypothetical protein
MTTYAKDFFKAADGHRRAVELLIDHEFRSDGSRDSVFFAIYNVLGFAVELYLKAFLAKSGMADSELWTRQYGHDLQRLFEEAKKRGFDVRLPEMVAIVDLLSAGHGSYGYRYVHDGSDLTYFQSLPLVLLVLRDVHASMQSELMEGRTHDE